MPAAALVHLLLLVGVLAMLVPVTGRYLAAVYGGERAPGDRLFGSIERVCIACAASMRRASSDGLAIYGRCWRSASSGLLCCTSS